MVGSNEKTPVAAAQPNGGASGKRRASRLAGTFEMVPVGELQTNCYLVNDGRGGVVVVDPGAEAERILAAVGERRVELVLLTHGHFDHVGALDELARVSAGGWACTATEWEDFAETLAEGARMFGSSAAVSVPPARLLAEGDEVAVGDLVFYVMECPGHTRGGATYVEGAYGLAFTGDTLFAGSAGRTDFAGGDHYALARSLARLGDLPLPMRVLPGHGPASTIACEVVHNPCLWQALHAR